MQMQAQPIFNIRPFIFYGFVKIRRIRWNKHHPKSMLIGYIINGIFLMMRCVIHKHNTFSRVLDFRNKNLLKPTLKQISVHRTLKCERRNKRIQKHSRNNACPLKISTTNFSNYLFSTERITIITRVILVKTGLVYVIKIRIIR